MKKILLLILATINIFAWEINTHRAIDRMALKNVTSGASSGVLSAPSSSTSNSNLENFLNDSGLKHYIFKKNEIGFDGYGMTYMQYILQGEGDSGISQWDQAFSDNYGLMANSKELIEAGTILEDAIWPNTVYFDGRFVNHFYDAQISGNGSKGLVYKGIRFLSADLWALRGIDTVNRHNLYSYTNALEYFKKGFMESNPSTRRKYQAKMLVSVGHLMHMINDMSVPAHVRADPHAEGDVMEVWARGGENGNKSTGFRVSGSTVKSYAGISRRPDNRVPKYGKFTDFITQEAYWTATHFFSKDSIFTKKYPRKSDTYEELFYNRDELEKYYVRSDSVSGIPRGTKLAIRVKSYITNILKEKYYRDDKLTMGFDMSTSFRGNYSVITDNARILIPRAIANARNFVNYFFRGQISAKIDGDNIIIKNISDKSFVKNRYTATLQYGGHYLVKYHNGDGVLHNFVFEYDLERSTHNIESIGTDVYSGGFTALRSLKPGESIVVPIKRDTSITSKHIVVVYDGNIGGERGLAVCSAKTPNVMRVD